MNDRPTRRRFLHAAASLALAGAARGEPGKGKALIAITLDLEMARQYPRREITHWDYEKGNLDADTKRYALEAGKRVAARGHVIHYFCVGRVLEQENIDWLRELSRLGHPIGNHTYDHLHMKARDVNGLQFRFERAPWLIANRRIDEVIAENIRWTTEGLKHRAGIKVSGFRTPGGFSDGLIDRPDLQELLLNQGFKWVSSKYPAHPNSSPGQPPDEKVFAGIVAAQADAQPFVYPSGLIEVPMSPISDVNAFRTARWKLPAFKEAIRRGVEWSIERGAAYDFLAHPSCLVVEDPKFETIDLIMDLAEKAGPKAAIVDLGTIAQRAGGVAS